MDATTPAPGQRFWTVRTATLGQILRGVSFTPGSQSGWYQAHDWKLPYPGDSKIYAPSRVPGAYIPSSETN